MKEYKKLWLLHSVIYLRVRHLQVVGSYYIESEGSQNVGNIEGFPSSSFAQSVFLSSWISCILLTYR